MSLNAKILIIDDEKPICDALKASLRDDGFIVEVAYSGRQGLEKIRDFNPEVVLQDIWMPGDMDGLQVLEEVQKGGYGDCRFIVMSGHGTIETAVRAVKNGAWDFVEKPLSIDKISISIANILSFKREQAEKNALLNRLRKDIAIVGETVVMVGLKQMAARVAPSPSWVLIKGESGVGKNLLAQNLHYLSHRAAGPWLELNCGAIPPELFELELLGYEKGAVVGAERSRRGKFELADRGTLYLNEVSELTIEAQSLVLSLLQEKRFKRIGSESFIDVDVRVIASSVKSLKAEVEAGRFRRDLFERLSLVTMEIPSLRQRIEDLPALVETIQAQIVRVSGTRAKTFTDQALAAMSSYAWPGNVRELRNFVERIHILTGAETVEVSDLRLAGLQDADAQQLSDTLASFREARAQFEKDFLQAKISENQGNISKTAESIGLERSYLHRKIKSYGIEV